MQTCSFACVFDMDPVAHLPDGVVNLEDVVDENFGCGPLPVVPELVDLCDDDGGGSIST